MDIKSFIKRKKSSSTQENENKDNEVEQKKPTAKKEKERRFGGKRVRRFVATSLALATTLAAGIFAGGLGYIDNLNNKEFSSQEDIKTIAASLNYDTSYATTKGLFAPHHPRFRNNGDKEPIYVSFEDGVDSQSKDVAVKTLDYVFGFLRYANDNYQYSVVDSWKTEAAHRSGKATIIFSDDKNDDKAEVKTKGGENVAYSYLVSNPTINQITIPYYADQASATLLRENYTKDLMSGLGFKNLDSNTTEAHTNTIMGGQSTSTYMGNNLYITPTDFAGILSLYSPRFESDEQRQEYINQSVQTLNDYSVQYYDKILSKAPEESLYGNENATTTRSGNFKTNDKIEYSYSEINDNGDIITHSITCAGGNYHYTISRSAKLDLTGNLTPKVVFEGDGKTIITSNGAVVLEDVNLPTEFNTCQHPLISTKQAYGMSKHTNFVLAEQDGVPYFEQVDYNSLSGRYNNGGDNQLFNQNGKLIVNGTLVSGHETSHQQ